MGLDGVELVMAAEERFGIQISDGEAECIRTPGMFVDLIYSKVAKSSENFCRSQRAFHILRRSLTENFGVARASVRLDVSLPALRIPGPPKEYWPQVQASVRATSWPALEYPARVYAARNVSILGTFSAGLLSSVWILIRPDSPMIGVAACAGIVCTFILAAKVKRVFDHLNAAGRTELPQNIRTVRDLISYVQSSREISWTRANVATAVRQIVINVLCLKPEIYREDADFVKDLGLN